MENNVAVLFRGAIRPDANTVVDNIRILRDSLVGSGYNPVTYLAAWTTDQSDMLNILQSSGLIDNILLIRPLTNEEIDPWVSGAVLRIGGQLHNTFRQYYLSKSALSVICNDWRVSHVVHSRTDMTIDFGEHSFRWFNNNYNTMHIRTDNSASFINDQFGVAPRELMQKCWHYDDIAQLSDFIQKSDRPEDVLQKMLDRNGIRAHSVPIGRWELNANRHVIP